MQVSPAHGCSTGPTPFLYKYSFKSLDKGTELYLEAEIKKEGLNEVLGTKALIAPEFDPASFFKRVVQENFQTLRSLLESPQISFDIL